MSRRIVTLGSGSNALQDNGWTEHTYRGRKYWQHPELTQDYPVVYRRACDVMKWVRNHFQECVDLAYSEGADGESLAKYFSDVTENMDSKMYASYMYIEQGIISV